MSKNIITFTKIVKHVDDLYSPQPATKFLPEWYKNTDGYIGEKKPYSQTIKKCIPVFDALTAGYIIPTQMDIWVEIKDGVQNYTTPDSNLPQMILFHPVKQAPFHPKMNQRPYPKFYNPYSIKTSSGYSCLFIPPLHQPNQYFNILPGMVDTDIYTANINFPFTLNDPNFEGLIPAGTPMIQVIPIKRDSWTMEFGEDKEKEKSLKDEDFLNSMFFNRYKNVFWNKKEYKWFIFWVGFQEVEIHFFLLF